MVEVQFKEGVWCPAMVTKCHPRTTATPTTIDYYDVKYLHLTMTGKIVPSSSSSSSKKKYEEDPNDEDDDAYIGKEITY